MYQLQLRRKKMHGLSDSFSVKGFSTSGLVHVYQLQLHCGLKLVVLTRLAVCIPP